MPEWTARFDGTPLTANEIGRQAGPQMTPFITSPYAPEQRARFTTEANPKRPFADVGKISVNFGDLAGTAGRAEQTGGFFQGVGGGIGRLLGNFIGQGQAGANIGEMIGSVPQAGLDLAGGLLGALPALPGVTELQGGKTLFDLPFMKEEERKKILDGWDGNPLALTRHLSDLNKEDWAAKIDAGQIDPLWGDLAPAASLGDQVMQLLGAFNLPSRAVERTLAGGPLDAVGRVMNTPDAHLNPKIVQLKHDYADGTISKDRLLDGLVMENAGYSNDWGLNMLGSMLLDPLLLGGEVAAVAGKASLVAKMEKAQKFVEMIGHDKFTELATSLTQRAEAAGRTVKEITNPEIMAEAQRLGIHGDALAEASKQLGARQRFLADNAFLEPIFNAANKVANGPLPAAISMIGRRGTKPLLNAWLTSRATMGVANAYGRHNFRAVQNALAELGVKDAFDQAMGHFTAQEGMAMQQELLGQDVISTRGLVDARPTNIAKARNVAGAMNYDRKIENFVGRRKVDVARPTGLETAGQAMERARETAVGQLVRIAGISGEEARTIVNRLDRDGLSMVDAAHYGWRIKVFNAAKRADQEALAAKRAATGRAGRVGRGGTPTDVVARTTLIGPRELSDGRAAALREALDTMPTADAAKVGRDAIRSYDAFGHLIADGPTDEEIVTSLKRWLDDFGDGLTKELAPDQIRKLPPELARTLDPESGYIYGLRPKDGVPEWRIRMGDDGTSIADSHPWMDIVGDVAQPWNARFNQDSSIGSMLNALDDVVSGMSHQITTDRIFIEARRAFTDKAMNGYAPSQKTALSYDGATKLWQGVLDKARELGTTPRGMSLPEFEDVLARDAVARSAGLTARDLMGMTLHAYEGRLGTVGVTQKFTGILKTSTRNLPILPENTLGRMAERMYPLVRFAMNPMFQLQEWVEPWVFMAARGKMARLSEGWVDPITGTRVEPTELMRVQQNLIDRYAATDPYAQFDQMERSLVYVYGSKAAKDVSKTADVSRIASARNALRNLGTVHERKAAAQSEMFRHFLGPILKEQLNSIDPTAWASLEALYGTRDMGHIAVRWLSETDAWANIEPRAANIRLQIAKAKHIGQEARVNLDALAEHGFGTTRDALVLRIKDGTLDHDTFKATLRDAGGHEDYIGRSWKAAQFEAKTGGVEAWWAQLTKGPAARPMTEVAHARRLVQVMAEVANVSELEFLSRNMNAHVSTLLQDDLLSGLETDYAGWEALFQKATEAENWWTRDPVTGEVVHANLDPEELERTFLDSAKNPPSTLPPSEHGAWDDMQKVQFGADVVDPATGKTTVARYVYIPGGEAALRDTSKPFTVWESHLIRNQLIDPNELLDPELKHALYMKMWRGHQFDMADSTNVFRVYNNLVMAMLSAGLNLTRNELINTRFRVNGMTELTSLANDAANIRATLTAALRAGEAVTAGDMGFAYSTTHNVAHYIPLDAIERYAKDSFRPEAAGNIRLRGRLASGYLKGADRELHTQTMRAAAQADAVKRVEAKAAKAVTAAEKELAALREAKAEVEDIAAAERKVADKKAAQAQIDPEQALRDIQAEDNAAIDSMDEEKIAEIDARAEKAVGRISEWAVDLAHEAIESPGNWLENLRRMDQPYGWGIPLKKIEADPTLEAKYRNAAARLSEDRTDTEARDILRELVPKAKQHDQAVAWKPWNLNGAGDPHLVNEAGDVVGHADEDLFAYIKNEDVKWRGFSTNSGMGNALQMAEDMTANPEHYVRRTGPEFAPKKGGPVPGYTIEYEADPFQYPYGEGAGQQSTMRASVSGITDQRGVRVKDADGNVVGFAYTVLDPETGKHVISQSQVLDPHGRKGLANWMYRTLEEKTGAVLTPSSDLSESARALWAQPNRPFGPPERSIREYQAGIETGSVKPVGEVHTVDPATLPSFNDVPEEYWPFDVNTFDDPTLSKMKPVEMTPDGKIIGMDNRARVQAARQQGVEPRVQVMGFPVEQGLEPLDEFAERISHRTRGLSLKTGFFGIDLGDPINFERGVMDTHMVGGLTEWLYHDVTNKGTDPRWGEWLASLSPAKQAQIKGWLERDYVMVPDKDPVTGKMLKTSHRVEWPDGAPRGAGTYDWSEATGNQINFKPAASAKPLDTVAAKAAFVRDRIDKSKAVDKERLYRMYRNDDELAQLYGRSIKTLAGDYAEYEKLMTERKGIEALTDPLLNEHGNGGYQWKLWDDRRRVLDPETSAYAAAHTMKNQSVQYLASSDTLHNSAGFLAKGGLKGVTELGYRYLDPSVTLMAQREGNTLRGATIFADRMDQVLAVTEHANASTVTHELAHSLLEPMLDESGRRVVLDDINRISAEIDDKVIADTATAKETVDRLAGEVVDMETTLTRAETAAKDAAKDATAKARAATKAEAEAQSLHEAALTQEGRLAQLRKDMPARRAVADAKRYPSERARSHGVLDRLLAREEDKLKNLTAARDARRADVPGLWDEATAARATVADLEQDVGIIRGGLKERKAEGLAAKQEYDRLATAPPRGVKDVWDRETSEHFADQYNVWLRTGKSANPKMRDLFAYFSRVLSKLEDWLKGNPQAKVSPAMQDLFDSLHTPKAQELLGGSNVVPFDATAEAFHAAGALSVEMAADAAHTNVQFRNSRSMFERSLNHPYFGVYPASYMWGKVAPEMIRALALNPFGLPIPGMVEGAVPGLGFLNAQRAWQSVEQQKDTDPKFRKFMTDPKNDKMFRAASMFLPATPWDDPANLPLWQRRLAEWGLESQQRVAQGQKPKAFDPLAVASDVMSYSYGPKASLDWLGDIARFGNAPLVQEQFAQPSGSGIESLATEQALAAGPAPANPLADMLTEGSANLRNSLNSQQQ
jgi:hypothetical protein